MQFTGIILAGGKSSRMGFDKSQILFKGNTFLNHAVNLLRNYTDEIIISSNRKIETDLKIFADSYKDIGPIGGLQTCLAEIKTQKAIVIPVDMPLLNTHIINKLINQADFNKEINIFKIENRYQMLVGIYDKSILQTIEKQITDKNYKLRNLLQKSSTHIIKLNTFKQEFINVNDNKQLAEINTSNGQ
jgi:molybdopterin-guanine dinucleotide biosynthesis protein A